MSDGTESRKAMPAAELSTTADEAAQWRQRLAEQNKQIAERISKRKLAFLFFLYVAVARGVLKLPFGRIAKLTATSLLVVLVASFKPAPKKKNPALPEPYTNYPVIGAIGWFFSAMSNCPVQQQLDDAKAVNWSNIELCSIGDARDISVINKRDIEWVLKDNWRNYTKNVEGAIGFNDVYGEILGRGIFGVDGTEWQAHRKTASYMFSNAALTTKMETSFRKHAALLVELLAEKASTGQKFNIQEVMQALTFDSICDIAFGVDPGAMETIVNKGARIDFLIRFDRIQQNLTGRFLMPGSVWLLFRKLGIFSERIIDEDAREVRAYVGKIIEARKKDPTAASKGDLLSLYVDTANKGADRAHLKEDAYLSDMVLNFMIAGRDTTSCTLTNLFFELSLDAKRCEKIGQKSASQRMREEFARVVGPSRGIRMEDLKALRFCCAVFNEVLRLHPPVSIDGRMCSSDDVLPSGVIVPKNTFVWIPNAAIGRNPHVWDRPDEFVPDRWLEATSGTEPIRRVDEYLHPVFWGGPRLCIGKDAARLEVVAVAKEFLQHYDFIAQDKNDLRIAPAPVQFYENGLWGSIKPFHA